MKASAGEIEERMKELAGLHPRLGESELDLLETALFLEESFGLLLSDPEIVPELMGSFDSLRRFVATKLEGR